MKILDTSGTNSEISLNTFIQLCRAEGYLTYLKQNFPKDWDKLLADVDGDELDYSKTFKKTK